MSSYKKIKSTIMVPEDTYKETRILAIRRGMDIGSLVDEALREKIVRDYQQMGLQPPFPQTQTQPPPRHEESAVHSSRYEAAKSQSQQQTQSKEERTVFDKITMFNNVKTIGIQDPDYDKIPYFDLKDMCLILPEEEEKILSKKQKQELSVATSFPFNLSINLPGVKFPATKKELVTYAKNANTQRINDILKEYLTDKTYLDIGHFKETLLSEISNRKGVVSPTFVKGFNKTLPLRRRVKLFVNIEDIRQVEQKHKREQMIQQQEQELKEQQIDTKQNA